MVLNSNTVDVDFRRKVETVVSTVIRPRLGEHGGNIRLHTVENHNVGFVLIGNCAGCPAAQITLEEVVRASLVRELGEEVGRVYLINETDEDMLGFARRILQHIN